MKRSLLALMLLLLTRAAISPASAQDTERTFGDSYIPLVYPARDTGAYLRTPDFPSFAQLPIVRPLPDLNRSRWKFAAARRSRKRDAGQPPV